MRNEVAPEGGAEVGGSRRKWRRIHGLQVRHFSNSFL